jgi:mRNA interferase MazF
MVELKETYNFMCRGLHPCLIIGNYLGLQHSPIVQVIPISSKSKSMPMHVELSKDCGLSKDSICLVEQITSINRSEIRYQLGKISYEKMLEVESALMKQMGVTNNYSLDTFKKVKTMLDEIEELNRFLVSRKNVEIERERDILIKDLERFCINYSIKIDISTIKSECEDNVMAV